MMKPIYLSNPVESLFECWPETIHLFIQNQMACPGCYLARFESLEGALQSYQITQKPFLDSLHQIVANRDGGKSQASREFPNSKGESWA